MPMASASSKTGLLFVQAAARRRSRIQPSSSSVYHYSQHQRRHASSAFVRRCHWQHAAPAPVWTTTTRNTILSSGIKKRPLSTSPLAKILQQQKQLQQRPSQIVNRQRSLYSNCSNRTTTTSLSPLVVGVYLVFLGRQQYYDSTTERTTTTECEQAVSTATAVKDNPLIVALNEESKRQQRSWRYQLYRAWRMFWRCCKLAVTLTPVAAGYPIFWWNQQKVMQLKEHLDTQDIVLLTDPNQDALQLPWLLRWYLKVCFSCVEASGAAVIKLMQWAGSRPDMFGPEFCAIFGQLQDHTTPHSWKHTERAMEQAFGPNWKQQIQLNQILGSGCIGQVYHGTVLAGTESQHHHKQQQQQQQHVAVKVLHPNVREGIEADLDLMRVAVHILDNVPFWESISWMNLPCVVEEFARILTIQLDLRTEADHLQRFRKNFESQPDIVFPKPLVEEFPPTRDVLVETYHPGIPIMQFARENQADRKLLSELCFKAIRCVCQMIFLDNFIHGDLHPGNVFVSPDGKDFILLDVGIVAEYSDADHEAIVDILSSFIRREPRKAGQFMIADSNRRRGQAALDEQHFLDKIEALGKHATAKENKMMEHLGHYITQIYDAAATHHILMNQSFVSAALAVKVQEGIALALDPKLEMWRVATPVIVESERRRHGLVKSAAKHIMGGGGAKDTSWTGYLQRKATAASAADAEPTRKTG